MSDDTKDPRAHVVRHGEGFPVIAVHGYGVDHRILLPLDEALASVEGLERIYLDLPGFGETPALTTPGDLQHLADWLVREITRLVGERPVALLGQSMGGLLVRHARAELGTQVVGMALIAPAVDPDADRRTRAEHRVVESDEELLSELDESGREEFTTLSARQTRATWELFRRFSLPGIRATDQDATKRLDAGYELSGDPEARAGVFTGVSVVVTGREDHVVGYEDQEELVRRWYPAATYAALHGAGHNVHLECPEVTNALVRQWAVDLPR